MDTKLDILTKHVRELADLVKEQNATVDKAVAANNAILQQIANEIALKIDLLCNGEASQKKPAKKIKTKQTYFKDMLKENIDSFVDNLYTLEDIQQLMEHPDVVSRKNEAHKISKLGELLLKEIAKDAAKSAALSELYDQYKHLDE